MFIESESHDHHSNIVENTSMIIKYWRRTSTFYCIYLHLLLIVGFTLLSHQSMEMVTISSLPYIHILTYIIFMIISQQIGDNLHCEFWYWGWLRTPIFSIVFMTFICKLNQRQTYRVSTINWSYTGTYRLVIIIHVH